MAVVDSLLDSLRVKLSGATDDLIQVELFNTIDELAREALRIAPPSDMDASPSTWLPDAQWAPNYQALMDGTLARMYAQVGRPWSSPELAKYHQDRYLVLLQLARSEASAVPGSIYERVLYNLRTVVPLARDGELRLAMFATVQKVRQDALNLAPLGDSDIDESTWLPSTAWDDAYLALLYGSLAYLYAEGNKAWSSSDLATLNQAKFIEELVHVRESDSASPSSVYNRILNNIRAQVPAIRAGALRLEIYNVADKIRREALRLAPLDAIDTDPEQWLPVTQWDDCYQAMLNGVLARLYSQTGRAWFNAQGAQMHYTLYLQELDLIRNETADATNDDTDKLMDMARVKLPGARDNIIQHELYASMEEFLRTTNVWVEEIEITTVVDEQTYVVIPTELATITRLISVVDSDDIDVRAYFKTPGELYLVTAPSTAETLTVKVALTVAGPTDDAGFPRAPSWIYSKYREDLLDGVVGRMMGHPAKPYSNERLAVYHLRRFRNAMAVAKAEGRHGYLFSGQQWKFPTAFSVR